MSGTSTRRRLSIGLLALSVSCLLSAGLAIAGTPTPQFSVTAGSARATAGKLKGSVSVYNDGPSGGRFYFSLVVALDSGNRRLKRVHEPGLSPSTSKTIRFSARVPANLPAGSDAVWACVGRSPKPPAPAVKNGCRQLTTIVVPGSGGPSSSTSGGGSGQPTSSPPATPPSSPPSSPAPSPPVSTVPTKPIAVTAEEPFVENDANFGFYWADVPASYDSSNQTPTPLLVWLHGCGGVARGDIFTVSPETVGPEARPRDWISIAVGGREEEGDECWHVGNGEDESLVFAAIADVETHFNIDRHRVILGGYSSGGDLSYRLAFDHANEFAGVLAENTAPFRDTGLTQQQALGEAARKFNVVHLAHNQDEEYKIAEVEQETEAMINAGFPLQLIRVDGEHANEPGDVVNGHPVPGTDADLIQFLLPHIDDGWTSP